MMCSLKHEAGAGAQAYSFRPPSSRPPPCMPAFPAHYRCSHVAPRNPVAPLKTPER